MIKFPRFFQVGGSIRDEFLGVKSKDIDFAVEAESFDAMRNEILDCGGKIFLETPQFLTIRANMPYLGNADYVLCRKDGAYSDGRRPDAVVVGDIFDDLARRDFTMNAIARNTRTGAILDPHCGVEDIERGLIRCVGSANHRFHEDKLRMFRAVRFAVTKNFRLDHDINHCIGTFTPMQFAGVSTERIREEMLKMFQADTLRSIRLLTMDFPVLWEVALQRGLWLKPTIEQKP